MELTPAEIEAQLSEMAEQAYGQVNRAIGHRVYRQAEQENATLSALAHSANPAQRLVYRRMVERLGSEPGEDVAARPLRQLADKMKDQIEAAFSDAYRLFRDRQLMLQAVDGLWVRHLTDLDALREGIGLRAYGQQNPLVAYRKEAHEMYEGLLARIQRTVARSVYLVPQALVTQPRGRGRQRLQAMRPRAPAEGRRAQPAREPARESLGRNDPCWCGSGKKYKHCHMRQDMANQGRSAAQRSQVAGRRPPRAPGRKRRQ
jgi:preprotein translocase subunit SecA